MIWSTMFFFSIFLASKKMIFVSKHLSFDPINLMILTLCPLIMFIPFMMKFKYYGGMEKKMFTTFYASILVSLLFCFSTTSITYFLVMLEMTIFPMTSMIFQFSKDKDKIMSVKFMFFLNILGSIPFMILLSFFTNYPLNIPEISMSFYKMNFIMSPTVTSMFLILLVSKLPIFLLHFWLTKAHVSASGALSMLLASMMIKIGSFGLLKFTTNFKIMMNSKINIFSLTMTGMMLMMMTMSRFLDVKNLVACSSIMHMSLIFPGLLFNTSMSATASMMMMIGHGLVSFFLFYLISKIYEKTQSRTSMYFSSLESVDKTTFMVFFIFMFLNLGVPPFINFYSEMLFCSFLANMTLILSMMILIMIASVMFCMFLNTLMTGIKKTKMESYKSKTSFVTKSIFYMNFMILFPFMM